MGAARVRRGRRSDARKFLDLVQALAEFEHLAPPNSEGRKRIVSDIFDKKRLHLFVALEEKEPVGYALYFFSYSSFLARPTLYLEDLFVLEGHRKKGLGSGLFARCADEAVKQGCGRMEWSVLDWNRKAVQFYERLGAKRLEEWHYYRLTKDQLESLTQTTRKSGGTGFPDHKP